MENHCVKNCPCEDFIELRKKVEAHEKRLAAGDTSFALLKKDIESLTTICAETNAAIKDIQNVPTRRVESVIDTIIRWAVPLFLGWVISRGGIV